MLSAWAMGVLVAGGPPLPAQATDDRLADETRTEEPRTEEVRYWNPGDSTLLSATLVLPREQGPHAGIVLLSVADTRGVVDALVRRG